jgi:2-haloacid dehalogenase
MNVSNKREVLMVGDNLNSDIRGGNGFGIDTCWFNPERLSRENGILPTYEIRALRELGALLDLR